METLKEKITRIIEDTAHSGRAEALIEEVIKPIAKEAFEAGEEWRSACIKIPDNAGKVAFGKEEWINENIK